MRSALECIACTRTRARDTKTCLYARTQQNAHNFLIVAVDREGCVCMCFECGITETKTQTYTHTHSRTLTHSLTHTHTLTHSLTHSRAHMASVVLRQTCYENDTQMKPECTQQRQQRQTVKKTSLGEEGGGRDRCTWERSDEHSNSGSKGYQEPMGSCAFHSSKMSRVQSESDSTVSALCSAKEEREEREKKEEKEEKGWVRRRGEIVLARGWR